MEKPKIYLAGPDVFRFNALEHGHYLKDLCDDAGAIGLWPFDNEANPPNAKNIFQGNFDMIRKCDAIVANILPFRGPSCDPGTAWELGAAKALGKKVVIYSTNRSDYNSRVNYGILNINPEFPSVEDFGLEDNLMIVKCADAFCDHVAQAIYKAVQLVRK